MRRTLQLLLGALLSMGIGASASAAPFSLKFDAGGADCAVEAGVTDCNVTDITDGSGVFHFDIGGGSQWW